VLEYESCDPLSKLLLVYNHGFKGLVSCNCTHYTYIQFIVCHCLFKCFLDAISNQSYIAIVLTPWVWRLTTRIDCRTFTTPLEIWNEIGYFGLLYCVILFVHPHAEQLRSPETTRDGRVLPLIAILHISATTSYGSTSHEG